MGGGGWGGVDTGRLPSAGTLASTCLETSHITPTTSAFRPSAGQAAAGGTSRFFL